MFWQQIEARFPQRVAPPGFAVTLELRGVADVSYELAEQDCQGLIDYLTHAGVIEGQAPELPPLLNPPTPLAGSKCWS